MRIFLSSTVYDLIDVRAEVADLLQRLGVAPVLSDDKLSDFAVQPDVNSIETCLVNVAASDEVIVILDKRYGPRLGNCGFPDVSATHLEYRHAVDNKIPVHVYVRDRLYADYAIWKRNSRKESVRLSWVHSKDFGLFRLLDEHTKLTADRATSNWYASFTNTLDLKKAIEKTFQPQLLPQQIVDAIQENRFPLFDVDLDVEHNEIQFNETLTFRTTVTNVGGAPAFNFRLYWEDKPKDTEEKAIIAPGKAVEMISMYGVGEKHRGCEQFLIAEYESPIGVSVCDRFRIHGRIQGTATKVLISGARLMDRQFTRGTDIQLNVKDV